MLGNSLKEEPVKLKLTSLPRTDMHPKLHRFRFTFDLSIGHCFYEFYICPEMMDDPKGFAAYSWMLLKGWINRNV